MLVNPFRRSRHARRWWQTPPALAGSDAVTEPMEMVTETTTESVEIVADVSEFARVLEAGVAATRARVESAGCFYDTTRGGVLTSPPPPMPGGAR